MTRESPFCKRDEIADSPTHLSRAFLARRLFWRCSIAASFVSSISLATGYWLLTTILPSHAPRPPPGLAGVGRAQALPRWLLPDTDRRIPHELQGPILHFRTLPSATASSRGVGEPGTGAKVVKLVFYTTIVSL